MKHLPNPMRECLIISIILISVQFFDHMGNFVEGGILSNETLTKSNERVVCFIEQYNEYEIPGLGGQKVFF